MKLTLRITKGGTSLYVGDYDVVDAATFGQACADAWSKLMERQFRRESSIGALMEHVEDEISSLDGALISVERVK
jgi:hypothetical protein